MQKHLVVAFGVIFFSALKTQAQNYHAINGSAYAVGLNVHNNPASIVNSPYRWDVTVIGMQAKASTNMLLVRKYSLLSRVSKSEYLFTTGGFSRYADANWSVNLFNAHLALKRSRSIAFGMNLRGYINANSGSYNYSDSILNVGEFLNLNERVESLTATMSHSAWIEIYGTYAKTIRETERGRLNAGVTLKLMRGLSGSYVRATNGRFARVGGGDPPLYRITDIDLQYGYSSNYDRWSSEGPASTNIGKFLRHTEGGISFDAGLEYLVAPQEVPEYDNDNYYDYTWKFGLSLLDAGFNQFKFGRESRSGSGVQPGITDESINLKIDSTIGSVSTLNDSLSTMLNRFSPLNGQFHVFNPARIVINADRFIRRAFYVNAELSLNLSTLAGNERLSVKDMSVLTVTPRWETSRFGAFLPIHYNNHHQLWVGAAIKAGPVLFGLYNLAYIFSKTSIQKGGGYIAIIIKSRHSAPSEKEKGVECPPF